MKYTTTFKKAVLRKVLPPENRSVHSVAVELGVGEMTIHRWIAQVKDGTISFEQGEENPTISKIENRQFQPNKKAFVIIYRNAPKCVRTKTSLK